MGVGTCEAGTPVAAFTELVLPARSAGCQVHEVIVREAPVREAWYELDPSTSLRENYAEAEHLLLTHP